MPDEQEKYAPPETSKGDVAHTLAKEGISAIPVVGGPAAELFAMVVTPPMDKRRRAWADSVGEGLRALETKFEGFRAESLSGNEAFISTVMHASQAAVRSHQQEKLNALRNAIMNVAIGKAPDEDVQLMFLNFVDTLTQWHLRILRFFQNPTEYGRHKGLVEGRWTMGGPATLLETYYPELSGHREIYDLVVTDLFARGLFAIPDLHTTMSGHGMFLSRTTGLGNQFLAFIASPV